MTKGLIAVGLGLSVVILVAVWFIFFGLGKSEKSQLFVITSGTRGSTIVQQLEEQGFIRNPWVFNLVFNLQGGRQIEPGGYYLTPAMNLWQIAGRLRATPDLWWVTIPEGLRREEIGEILAKTFNWNADQIKVWDDTGADVNPEYVEGVYFPDTYLFPVAEDGQTVAKRFISRFNEAFQPYFERFRAADIRWTTGLKLASIVQREAAGKADMPLIAGILWNRLDTEMKLEVDATVQYARGKTSSGWWTSITVDDITVDSPYNTYLYKGLPPHPIANPGLDAIEAVLQPAETDCLYYLHDSRRQIHCAKTYQEHKGNVDTYLK